MKLTLSLGSDALEFVLVAGVTTAILFVAAQLVLRLTAWGRKRRHAAAALPAEAGRESPNAPPSAE